MQVGVFAFIQNNEGKILFVQDASREQKWTMPGGGLEFQELVHSAVIREAQEEIGVTVVPERLLGIFSQQKTPGIVILFKCSITTEDFVLQKDEAQSIGYFSIEELEKISPTIKPAQLSMVRQIVRAVTDEIIYSDFSI